MCDQLDHAYKLWRVGVCKQNIHISPGCPLFWGDPKKLSEKTNMDMVIGM
jgi:hypothetical protein